MQNSNQLLNFTSHCSIASIYCLKKALNESQWGPAELANCGFIFATTTSQIDLWQKSLPLCYSKELKFNEITTATQFQSLGKTMVELQKLFHISGPSTVIASSCSASLQALNIASLWIKTGRVKRCLVGTTEILSDLTINGFNSLRLLSKAVCKPFDKNRLGINLGEASAFICLEADDLSECKAQGYIAGTGFSTDAYHPTAPSPEGIGSLASMKMALQTANITPEEIDWVYAHGTGSSANDLAESNAFQEFFKNSKTKPAVSSTKSIHGHTLGACGALEVVLSLLAFKENVILPTFNIRDIDPAIQLDIVKQVRQKDLRYILKNSLGFGGINASLILSKESGLS
jgi:3-oxoacyl-(acyl-carrier-protein) synthase